MPVELGRTARVLAGSVAAASLLSLSPASLVWAAGSSQPMAPTAASSGAAALVARADEALSSGRVYEAQAILRETIREAEAAGLDAPQRERAVELLARADRAVQNTDVVELSLQKAEFFLLTGDLRQADRQLAGLSRRGELADAAAQRHGQIRARVAAARETMAPRVPALLEQARADFEAQRYAEAKAALSEVFRSGVELSGDQRVVLDGYQMKIVELERSAGRAFGSPQAALGMLQPGTVRREVPPKPAPAPDAPADSGTQNGQNGQNGGAQPAAAEPAPAPVADPAPAPAPEPVQTPAVAEPMPTPAPAPAPAAEPAPAAAPMGGEDLISVAMRAEAQRLIAEADQAYDAGRYNEAVRKYEVALLSGRQFLSAEEVARVEGRMAEARLRLKANVGQAGLGEQAVQSIALIRERAGAEFENELQQGEKALAAGDTSAARELAARARLTADRARPYFSQSEYDAFAKKVDEFKARVETAEEDIRLREARTREETLKAKAAESQRTLREEKDRKIRESIERARALQQEQKYEEALQVIDQVLFLDPNNPAGLLLRDVIGDIVVYRRSEAILRQKAVNRQIINLENDEATVPPTRMINYPADWPQKTFTRGELAAYAESPDTRRALAALERRIPAQFSDNALSDVVAYVGEVTGTNVDVDWESLRAIGVDRDTPVSLNLSDVPASQALERALKRASRDPNARAGFAVIDGIVTIASDDALEQNVVPVPYNVNDLLIDIPAFTDVPDMDLASVLSDSDDGRSPFAASSRRDDRTSREERVGQLVSVIQSHVAPDSWRDHGGDTGSIQELNGSLIITTTAANHREIVGLLSRLRDIRSLQINVESRFLAVNQDFFEQIGFDLDVYFNTRSSQVTTAQGLDPSIQPRDFFNFESNQPLRRVLDSNNYAGGGSVTPVLVGPGTTNRAQQNVQNPNRFSPIGAEGNSLGITSGLASGFSPFVGEILSAAPALGIAGQFLDDVQVDFLIRATQADRRSSTLTAPRLTLTNGQTANVLVASQLSFVSDLEPVVADSAVGFDPDTEVITEGVTLLVEGVVSADRRYVTINVETSVTQVQRPFRQVPVTAVAGGQLVNSAAVNSFIELPTLNVTRVQTTVTVPDEGTVLLGGQRLVSEIEVETGVPVLSKLPIINRFFTNRVQAKSESTLLILLKPTVLIQTEEEERNFPGLLDSVRTGLGN